MAQTRARRPSWIAAAAAAFLLLASAFAGAARAQENGQDAIARVVDLNREAVAQYQKKHFDAARKVLKQALELCESAGLDHHPVAARTHVHLGIVIIAGWGQREIASRQFNEALQIDPNIGLTPGLETPEAQEVFNEAVVAVSPKSAPRAPAAPVASDDEAPAAPAAPPEERPRPARAEGADDDDAPKVARRAPKRAGDDDDADEAGPKLASKVQVSALLGGGFGWASGMGDVNADTPVSSGFAAAKLGHLELEGGYWLSDELMLSLEGRFQMVTGATEVEANGHTYKPATYATAVFAKGTWSPSSTGVRPYLSAAIGGGRIRHEVTLASLHDCGPTRNQTCVDTVGAGPFLAGVGGGLMYDLGASLALVAALNTQVAAPTFTFNVDLNLGVALRL